MDNSTILDISATDVKFAFRQKDKTEPEWSYELRKKGWEFYSDSPLPQRSDHLWRYNNPASFDIENSERFVKGSPGISESPSDKTVKISEISAGFGIIEPGFQSAVQWNSDFKNTGIIFTDLFSALKENSELVERYLGKLVGPDFGKFEALNHALWNAGLLLYIPDNMKLEAPIHIQYSPASDFDFRRLLIIVGNNVEATIIDDYSGGKSDGATISNGVFEIFVGDNSKLRFLNINRTSGNIRSYITGRGEIGRDTTIESVYAGFGGGNTKVNTGVILNGKGSNSRMTGFVFGDKKRITDFHTRHHHVSGESYSDLNFKAVVKDESQSVYTGLIRIEKKADNCEAFQENRNLILNKSARAESIPELEILTDQVRCSHGATMGPVDPELLFFMKSRGISEPTAIQLVIEGFFESAMTKLPDVFKDMLKSELSLKIKAS